MTQEPNPSPTTRPDPLLIPGHGGDLPVQFDAAAIALAARNR